MNTLSEVFTCLHQMYMTQTHKSICDIQNSNGKDTLMPRSSYLHKSSFTDSRRSLRVPVKDSKTIILSSASIFLFYTSARGLYKTEIVYYITQLQYYVRLDCHLDRGTVYVLFIRVDNNPSQDTSFIDEERMLKDVTFCFPAYTWTHVDIRLQDGG